MAGEASAVFVRLMAYVCGVAVLALIAADLYAHLNTEPAVLPSPVPVTRPGWVAASRPRPAFALRSGDFQGTTESYEIFRRPGGARKDILRWTADGEKIPVVEIEIDRPGSAAEHLASPAADLARRMGLSIVTEPETAGVVETKFGPVTLWRLPDAPPACLGFAKDFDKGEPRLRISGWACKADSPSRYRLIGCTVDRLILLSAGNDAKLAELFAHAELKRGGCGAAPDGSPDWVTADGDPKLRGRL
jgi:hypothetical protein